MKFIASFGHKNTFTLDIAPITNAMFVEQRMRERGQVSDIDKIAYHDNPSAPHRNSTFEKAKRLAEGAHVAFA